MRWYDAKKYKPCVDNQIEYLVRVEHLKVRTSYLAIADYTNYVWIDIHEDHIEDEENIVTHFCIPSPIPIE